MARVNENFLKLKSGYLFPEIGRRVTAYAAAHPGERILRLGIGDVVRALPPTVIRAFHEGVEDLARDESFKGYGPEQGYAFLREAAARADFAARGARVEADEIFVSDGSKCDCANIQEIFSLDSVLAVSDPVYPVYVDSNVMAGRTGPADESGRYAGLVYLRCTEASGFRPPLPDHHVDFVWLCSPNNPTGSVLRRADLEAWVSWARREKAVLLFDAAYESYIREEGVPHSIYEIPGAREVAIEFRSYSKTAGFTGARCAYLVIPKDLKGCDAAGKEVSLHSLWNRRHSTKFNGASYPVQKAAAAIYTPEGRHEVRAIADFYMENASLIRAGLQKRGFTVYGGDNAPYIWLKTPKGLGSWEFFDELLNRAQVVGTPGAGFGAAGEGWFRLSSFAQRTTVIEALERIGRVF